MADGCYLEYIEKSPYSHKNVTNFDEILHGDASPLHRVGVKNSFFFKPKTADVFGIV